MKKPLIWLVLVMALSVLMLSACGGGSTAKDEKPTVPAAYAGKTNPFAGNADAATAGKALYTTNCASCHGDTGKGDGAAGASLDPKPADFTVVLKTVNADYLYWRVAEGGAMAPFNSSMPAWKGILTEDEMWQVVTYIETWK